LGQVLFRRPGFGGEAASIGDAYDGVWGQGSSVVQGQSPWSGGIAGEAPRSWNLLLRK